jgi:hypothetical protein
VSRYTGRKNTVSNLNLFTGPKVPGKEGLSGIFRQADQIGKQITVPAVARLVGVIEEAQGIIAIIKQTHINGMILIHFFSVYVAAGQISLMISRILLTLSLKNSLTKWATTPGLS